jgi:two-component system phosphate regulon response regulator PhoB
MAKILLVEDDFSLRDIFSASLQAEGYQVVTASDGEEALAVAMREKPDLIMLDVMMPKISGFDVLDILRSTPETKDVKVIMMTALSQETDRARGEALGVDKYLVKSQVPLPDVMAQVKQVLGGAAAKPSTPPKPPAQG